LPFPSPSPVPPSLEEGTVPFSLQTDFGPFSFQVKVEETPTLRSFFSFQIRTNSFGPVQFFPPFHSPIQPPCPLARLGLRFLWAFFHIPGPPRTVLSIPSSFFFFRRVVFFPLQLSPASSVGPCPKFDFFFFSTRPFWV